MSFLPKKKENQIKDIIQDYTLEKANVSEIQSETKVIGSTKIQLKNKINYDSGGTVTRKLLFPKLRSKSNSNKFSKSFKADPRDSPLTTLKPPKLSKSLQIRKRKLLDSRKSSNEDKTSSSSDSSNSSSSSSPSSSSSYKENSKYLDHHHHFPHSFVKRDENFRRKGYKRQRLNRNGVYKSRFVESNKAITISFVGGYCIPMSLMLLYKYLRG